MFVFSIVLFWRKFKRQATNEAEPTSCGFSEFFNIDVKLWMEFLAIIYYYPASNTVSVIIYALNEWREPNIFGVKGGNDGEVRKELAIPFFWIPRGLMNEQSWSTSICVHFKLLNMMTLLISLRTVNEHDIFAANRLCHVAAHSIARVSQAWYITGHSILWR